MAVLTILIKQHKHDIDKMITQLYVSNCACNMFQSLCNTTAQNPSALVAYKLLRQCHNAYVEWHVCSRHHLSSEFLMCVLRLTTLADKMIIAMSCTPW